MTECNSLCWLENAKLQWKEIQHRRLVCGGPCEGSWVCEVENSCQGRVSLSKGKKEGVVGGWRFFGKYRKQGGMTE